MGRSSRIMPKPAVKKTMKLAYAAEIGKLKAKKHIENLKKIPEKFKETFLEMLEKVDMLEATAVLGATYLIKTGIDWAEQFAQAAAQPTGNILDFWLRTFDPLNVFGLQGVGSAAGEATQIGLNALKNAPLTEVIEWVVSFTLAYLIVHNFGAIMEGVGSAAGSVVGLAKGLLLI